MPKSSTRYDLLRSCSGKSFSARNVDAAIPIPRPRARRARVRANALKLFWEALGISPEALLKLF
eukprot:6651366-Pyramimonas_sp.AAC.1